MLQRLIHAWIDRGEAVVLRLVTGPRSTRPWVHTHDSP